MATFQKNSILPFSRRLKDLRTTNPTKSFAFLRSHRGTGEEAAPNGARQGECGPRSSVSLEKLADEGMLAVTVEVLSGHSL